MTEAYAPGVMEAANRRIVARAGAYAIACFFIWGLAYGLLDVLNKHFQETLHVGKAQSTWLQIAYFGAYFLMSLPSGLLMERRGYKFALVAGLLVTAAGALLFVPAAQALSFPAFVGAMFVLASGLCCLETASETYVSCLGAPAGSTRRLNLAQGFSGLGTVIGPLLGGAVFFSPVVTAAFGGPHRSIQATYAVIALGVLVFAFALGRTRLPETTAVEEEAGGLPQPSLRDLLRRRTFVLAVATQVLYVGAQVGVGAFFINLVVETWPHATSQDAAYMLSLTMALYLFGRFANTWLLTCVPARRMLMVYGATACALMLVTSLGIIRVSALALSAAFFFMAPMFGTIFGLGAEGLGHASKRGFSVMVMAISGGALLPYPMGRLAEAYGTHAAFLLPAVSFAAVTLYAWKGAGRRPAAA